MISEEGAIVKQNAYTKNIIMSSSKYEEERKYWLEKLKGVELSSSFPTDFAYSMEKKPNMQSTCFSLSNHLSEKVVSICNDSELAIYTLLLCAVKYLTFMYTGNEDIVLGMPAFNGEKDDENWIADIVALRTKINSNCTFKEFLLDVKKTVSEARKYRNVPVDKVIEILDLNLDLSTQAYMKTFVTMKSLHDQERLKEFEPNMIFTFEHLNNISIDISYNENIYEKSTIERVSRHFVIFLKIVLYNTDIRLSEIMVMSEEEIEFQLNGCNNTYAEYPRNKTIQELFEEKVEDTPENIAVKFANYSITYRQLNEKSNRLARVLQLYGAGPNQIVAIVVERSIDMIVGIMAILKSGSAYMPIDPNYPEERIRYTLEDSGAGIVLTQSSFINMIKYEGKMICLDNESSYCDNGTNLEKINEPRDLAYVIYTSGTTGKPKGAMIEHRNVVRLLRNDAFQFEFSNQDVWTMFHSFCFDFSVWEMYGALLYGGTLIVLPKSISRNPSEFLKLLITENVTVLNQTPTAFYSLMNEDLQEVKSDLKLKYVIFGGEALKPIALKQWKTRYPQVKLINMYGITETTVHVTYKEISKEEIESNIRNIGKPIPTLTTYIMDNNMKLVPLGVIGELCVGGEGVGRGYINRPELTKNRFVENPYKLGERLYKSGDLAKLLPNGDLEYIGRKDHQVKIRGHRIELGEIERVLLDNENIKDIVVVVDERHDSDKYLTAYFVSNQRISIAELREKLKKTLPDYMIPAFFVQLEKIPMNSNGKVDRKALPQPTVNTSNGIEYVSPQNEIEEKLVMMFSKVLDIEKIGINDNFFDIGGNSILLIKLHALLDTEYPSVLSVAEMFSYPTVRKLAECIETKGRNIEHVKDIQGIQIPENARVGSEPYLSRVNKNMKTEEVPIRDVAVIGMAVKMPMADSIQEFWSNITSGTDCIRRFPDTRKNDTNEYLKYIKKFSDDLNYNETACLQDIDKFDYQFFNISPSEAALMDPHQRIFLETVWKAIEDSGYGGGRLSGSRTGVYVGHIGKANYKEFIADIDPSLLPLSTAGNIPQMVASRISYMLDLKGPSMLIDTACSSSLVAVHLACRDIINKDCELAIAGGVKINFIPINFEDKFGVESSDARTRTFDNNSDGTGIGEGAGAVLLKPLNKALEDGDRIYAVIKGSFINQDGSSIGITAPNPVAQEDVIINAWKDAGIDPLTISYIETHGTATKLGDPIEIEGIGRAFKRYNAPNQFCAVGSIKTNLGHLDSAAGITGFIKSALALKYGIIPPSINFCKVNSNISFIDGPVYVNIKQKEWKTVGTQRRCGVSSFGIGGTNCHIVLEEAPKELQRDEEYGSKNLWIFTLSAKSEDALIEIVNEYKNLLQRDNKIRIQDICYTASVGRGHYNYRMAILAESVEVLCKKLEKIITLANDNEEDIYYGRHQVVNSSNEILEDYDITEKAKTILNMSAADKLDEYVFENKQSSAVAREICNIYIKGAEINWSQIYTVGFYKKVNLPTYPFRKTKCWLEVPSNKLLKVDNENFYYCMRWNPDENIYTDTDSSNQSILIFEGEGEKSKEVIEQLNSEGMEIIKVRIGHKFKKITENLYEIANDYLDYENLFKTIQVERLTKIVHMFTLCDQYENATFDDLDRALECGVYSLFRIYKALTLSKPNISLELILICDNANEVSGREKIIKPENAAVFGMGKVINIENSMVKCRCVDIDMDTPSDKIAHEVAVNTPYYKIAYRHGKRFIEVLDKMDISQVSRKITTITDQGVYIITGGTGGIGLEIAKFLSTRGNTNIVLINRSKIPDRSTWDMIVNKGEDSKLCRVINAIREIEENRSKVECLDCDISLENKLEHVLSTLREKYGKIRGVIHCAGVGVGEVSKSIAEENEEGLKAALTAKVYGTWVLQKLLMKDELDFFACFTSPITLMGGFGQGGYTCANSYIDSFVFADRKKFKRTFSVGWAPWKNTVEKMGNLFIKNKQLFEVLPTNTLVSCFSELLDRDVTTVFAGSMNYRSTLFNHMNNSFSLNFSKEIKQLVNKSMNGKLNNLDEIKIDSVKLVGKNDGDYSETEIQVAQIIGKLLGHNQINIFDNFYNLGGDSIYASRVINQINQLYNINLEISELMKYSTLNGFTDHLSEKYLTGDKTINIFTKIKPVGERDYYPVSSAQKRLFILSQLEKESTNYNWPIILLLKGKIDKIKLEQSFRELLNRHESLRTSYNFVDGEPVQIVHKNISFSIMHSISDKEMIDIKEYIKPFNIEEVPLFRVSLIELQKEKYILLFDMHHIISDGISTGILVHEFAELYNGERLPALRLQYKDYACWQNEIMQSEYMKKQEKYWITHLKDFDYTELNRKKTESTVKDGETEIKLIINQELTKAIDDFCISHKVTRFVFMLSIFNLIIYKETNQDSICLGIPVIGRRHSEFENTIGIFLNVLCHKTVIFSSMTFKDYIESVNQTVLNMWDNQDYPYEELYAKLVKLRKLKVKSLFSILFNYVPHKNKEDISLNGVEVEKLNFDIPPKYPLTLYVREERCSLLLDAVYMNSYYDGFRISRILNNIVSMIDKVLNNENLSIREIDFKVDTRISEEVSELDDFFDNDEFL